ncbi:hypothetical protein BHM03_00040756, partial [Ensete ventricosum]
TVDAAATGGGVGGGVADVAFLSGRCLRFLRPQGYHHRWAEEDSNVRFHSLPQEHPGGKASNAVGNVAFSVSCSCTVILPRQNLNFVDWIVSRCSEITQPFPALSAKVTAPSHSVPQFVAFLDLWQYYFGGNYDLVRFIKLVKQAGLYVHLRIGPYVCAEWNFGYEIENEYGPVEYYGGAAAKNYVTWAARMAVGLNTGVPWVMCKQDDAPDPVNVGNHFETWNAGVLGPVTLEGLNEGKRDLSSQKWIYQ